MPEATSQAFAPHPFPGDAGHTYIYRTGDLGMFIGVRHFVLLGRIDFQFKVDGNRVQPEEVESSDLSQVSRSEADMLTSSLNSLYRC